MGKGWGGDNGSVSFNVWHHPPMTLAP